MIGEIKFTVFHKRLIDHVPCDGRALLIKEYKELFDVIGYEYGKNPPDGTFYLPNVPSVSTEVRIIIQTKGEMPKFA